MEFFFKRNMDIDCIHGCLIAHLLKITFEIKRRWCGRITRWINNIPKRFWNGPCWSRASDILYSINDCGLHVYSARVSARGSSSSLSLSLVRNNDLWRRAYKREEPRRAVNSRPALRSVPMQKFRLHCRARRWCIFLKIHATFASASSSDL